MRRSMQKKQLQCLIEIQDSPRWDSSRDDKLDIYS